LDELSVPGADAGVTHVPHTAMTVTVLQENTKQHKQHVLSLFKFDKKIHILLIMARQFP
jgi:hypothetical protein